VNITLETVGLSILYWSVIIIIVFKKVRNFLSPVWLMWHKLS